MPLREIQRLVDHGQYRYSQKVEDLMEDGAFDTDDLEYCILSAPSIYKRERDELGNAIDGMKYVILGRDRSGRPFYTVGKMLRSHRGRVYFFLTAHQAYRS
jgi:hypothetical protein